jgi:DNA-binding transcriptional MerR regulator
MSKPLSTGDAASHVGVAPWQIRRLYERGILPPAARVGSYRVIDPDELPKIEAALRDAGYLPPRDASQADVPGVSS